MEVVIMDEQNSMPVASPVTESTPSAQPAPVAKDTAKPVAKDTQNTGTQQPVKAGLSDKLKEAIKAIKAKKASSSNGNVVGDTTKQTQQPTPTKAPQNATPKQLSVEQVNQIVQRRINASKTGLYTKHGVKDEVEFNALIDRAKGYSDLQAKYNENIAKLQQLETKNLVSDMNVRKDRVEDVLAFMKGKELTVNAENLKQILTSHPEWLITEPEPAVQPAKVGNTGSTQAPKVSDKDSIRNLFPSLSRK
jgi:hypothetical protein